MKERYNLYVMKPVGWNRDKFALFSCQGDALGNVKVSPDFDTQEEVDKWFHENLGEGAKSEADKYVYYKQTPAYKNTLAGRGEAFNKAVNEFWVELQKLPPFTWVKWVMDKICGVKQ